MSKWWKFTGYRIPLFSALAIVSLSTHLIYYRDLAASERAQMEARISILESIVERLKSGQKISPDELERMKRLARPSSSQVEDVTAGELTWKEALLGKKK